MDLRVCLSIPVPAIRAATALLSDAADAHAEGRRSEASELIRAADCDDIRAWTSTIMGRINGQIHGPGPLPSVAKIPAASLDPVRMPRREQKKELIERDGWNCRFCGMELICRSTLNRVRKAYPGETNWQDTEARKHALLRIMAVQFDHITPHCRGGQTVLDNLVITCAPCNYGRSSWTLEESRLIDPRTRPIVRTDWDGLAGTFLPVQDLRRE